jgi:hypothetical protein
MMNKWFPTKRYIRAIMVIYGGVAIATIVVFIAAVALYARPVEALGMISATATILVLLGRSLHLNDARSSLMRAIGSAHQSTHRSRLTLF